MNFYLPFLFFLFLIIINALSIESNVIKCLEDEKSALLQFKAELIDDYGRFSTWETEECCKWKGVHCDNRTNHVVSLNLRGPQSEEDDSEMSPQPLRGKLSHSLLKLVDLGYVDLSNNDFSSIQVPRFIGSFKKLQHLNLSHSNFDGSVPHHLGNLSTLRVLDLSGNHLNVNDLYWLVGLRSLQYLNLNDVDLREVKVWLGIIYKLKSLERLYLQGCQIQESTDLFSSSNASSNSLSILDLSFNELNISTLIWFCNFSSSLSYIDVSSNNLEGRIPDCLGDLMFVSYLDLSWNNFEGGFPESHGNLSNLIFLDLSHNQMDGDLVHIPVFLSRSKKLELIDISQNRFYGSIPPLSEYSMLKSLSIGGNQLNGSFIERKLTLPYLRTLYVSENQLTGRIPDLSSCSSLEILDLSHNMFNESLPETIWYLSSLVLLDLHSNNLVGLVSEFHLFNLSKLSSLDLSFNSNLTLRINSKWTPSFQLKILDLAYCNLGPNFPEWIQNQREIEHIDISSSKISDTVPEWFWNNSQMLSHLNMSYNHLHGFLPNLSHNMLRVLDLSSNEFNGLIPLMSSIPPYIDLSRNRLSGNILNFCNASSDNRVLDLSDNLLSGEISRNCLMNLMILENLSLGNNNFSGKIPKIRSRLHCNLVFLNLRNNSFTGSICVSLRNCKDLRILDLAENYFTGKIPTWIGESLLNLGVLVLRSNELDSILPTNLCKLENIQILDISMNKVFGTIPRCLNNFSIMATNSDPFEYRRFALGSEEYDGYYHANAYIMWKGQNTKYVTTLGMVKVIDFSSNNLVGEIPTEISSLIGLIGLNLSQNNLVGSIPSGIGELEYLNFLDLSENNLSSGIPMTISQLNHLGVLNLSYNNFSGRIPWRNHLETFTDSAFIGNPGLCGLPLLKLCPGDQRPRILNPTSNIDDFKNKDEYISLGFYVSLSIGFVIAFWGVFGTLTFINDWLYVKIQVNKNRFLLLCNEFGFF